MNRIEPISPEMLDKNWEPIGKLLGSVLDKVDSGLTISTIVDAIRHGDMQLWGVNNYEAIAITEIQSLPMHKVLTIIFLSGKNMARWLEDLINLLTAFGANYDCKYIEFYGRPGWEKKAPDVGFERKYTVMARRIHGNG